jgi:two-component system, OmpR family, sensor kinase
MRGARIDPRSALRRTRLRLPIRWKLALVSASLTFVILLLFAIFVGVFTEQRLRSSFDDDLRATAADLQEGFRLQPNLGTDPDLTVPRETLRTAGAGGAVIRILDRSGRVLARTERAPDLGPAVEGVRDAGDYRVVSRPLFAPSLQRSNQLGLIEPLQGVVAYVQYGKPKRNVETTLGRVRLFLAGGVLGGTALALIAGLAVARRAMRPIAGLTRAAREIGRTRDPARRLPRPVANDEVADLARTLEEMLRELDAARGETEAALSRQREFVADASHELRTPLTSILANLELLHAELSGEDAEIAGSALRSSRRMRRLVADLLLLARADAGRRAPRKPVDVGAVVRDAVAEAAPIAAGRELALDVPDTHGSATPAFVEGSPDDLHRLALNLIENALIHTPAGTTVRASVRRETPRAVDGAFGTAVVLEVADDGPGIPAAMRHRIFDRFARGAGDAGPVRGGSGLGLAIVRAVTEAHGGTVTLDERERGGARFVVRLPAIAAPKPTAPTRARLARRRVVG